MPTIITTTATFTLGPILDDNSGTITATIYLSGNPVTPIKMVLWSASSSPTYSEIGDWTNAQAISQITSLLSLGSTGN